MMWPLGLDQSWEIIVETMMEGLMVVDAGGVIQAVNRAMTEITGYTKAELLGQPCTVLECDRCREARSQGQGKVCDLFHKGEVKRTRCSLRRKDGTNFTFLKNAVILKDDQGRVIGGVETLTDLSEVVAKDRVISRLRKELAREDGLEGLIGKSPAMQSLYQILRSAAASEAPVLLYGDSGTGKELAAAALHRLGPRRRGPFIRVNSAALTESLLESELFGHVKGAFTGADRTRVGRFEAASGGDIFLDEIGDLPLTTQAKLLRVLQEKVIERVGDHRPIPINVRIISATNKDLERLMAQGQFREDLFFRLNVIPIHLPRLKERRDDIPLLAETFIDRACLKTDKAITGMSPEALELLLHHSWPGNVRELINVIDYAFVLCPGGQILPQHLPASVRLPGQRPGSTRPRHADTARGDDRERLVQALSQAGGKMTEAARLLGISRVTLWKRLKEHQLTVDRIIRG